jgi:spore germination protein YaaH
LIILAVFSIILALLVPMTVSVPRELKIESRGYLFNGGTSIYTHYVDRANGSLTVVCPDYFEIDSNGGVIQTHKPDPYFIETMHKDGIRVVPFLSNHWSMERGRLAMTKAAEISDKLAAWTKEYGFDGIDVDIENLNQNDKASFTNFVKTLREKLPKDKLLSVAVAANPWEISTGWPGQYDMKALGGICDAVFIMAYDEHYDGDTVPGPVGSYSFAEKSLKAALKSVPASKVMLGIPFYGRYWVEGKEVGGKAFTISDIENLISRYKSEVWYDKNNDCARAKITITDQDVVAGLWGGKKLGAGVYDVWYENSESLKKKLSLVKKYGIRGAGSWALGQEPEHIWGDYRKWLYGLPFSDISRHWAEEAISGVYEKGIVSGVGRGLFAPERSMTRAEACVMLCKLIGADVSSAQSLGGDSAGHWAEKYLSFCAENGIMSGYGGGEYRPNGLVTREEFASLAEKVLYLPSAIDYNQIIFNDISPAVWSNNAVVTLAVMKVVSGTPSGSFEPKKTITRAEAASMINKMTSLPLKVPAGRERVIEPR